MRHPRRKPASGRGQMLREFQKTGLKNSLGIFQRLAGCVFGSEVTVCHANAMVANAKRHEPRRTNDERDEPRRPRPGLRPGDHQDHAAGFRRGLGSAERCTGTASTRWSSPSMPTTRNGKSGTAASRSSGFSGWPTSGGLQLGPRSADVPSDLRHASTSHRTATRPTRAALAEMLDGTEPLSSNLVARPENEPSPRREWRLDLQSDDAAGAGPRASRTPAC